MSCVQTPASPLRHRGEVCSLFLETAEKRCRALRCSPAPSCPRRSRAAAGSWFGAGPAARQVFGTDAQLCGCLHRDSVAQTSVALGNEDLVEFSSLDPLQRHLRGGLAKQTRKASFRTFESFACVSINLRFPIKLCQYEHCIFQCKAMLKLKLLKERLIGRAPSGEGS